MKYKSKLEERFARCFKLPYEVSKFPYVVTHNYTPDFKVSPTAYIETKGRFTGSDRSKHLYIKQQHPELSILLVFQNPNITLSKRSLTRYRDWCDKNSIPWCSIDDQHAITQFISKHGVPAGSALTGK